jgi:hypothetical protein
MEITQSILHVRNQNNLHGGSIKLNPYLETYKSSLHTIRPQATCCESYSGTSRKIGQSSVRPNSGRFVVFYWYLERSLTHSLTHSLPHSLTPSLTHSLTPHSTVLLEKLTGLQLVKKFPTFYVIRRFITAITKAHHLSLSWASPIQSKPHIQLPKDPF